MYSYIRTSFNCPFQISLKTMLIYVDAHLLKPSQTIGVHQNHFAYHFPFEVQFRNAEKLLTVHIEKLSTVHTLIRIPVIYMKP